MFTCPICKKQTSDRTANGRPRKTCGQPKCVRALRFVQVDKVEYYCRWCDQTKMIYARGNRETCGDRKCVNKYSNHRRDELKRIANPSMKTREKPKGIDLIPIEDLQADYPTFYGLVKINKTKMVRCLKCHRTFESTSGHRICAECTRKNSNIGALAYGL